MEERQESIYLVYVDRLQWAMSTEDAGGVCLPNRVTRRQNDCCARVANPKRIYETDISWGIKEIIATHILRDCRGVDIAPHLKIEMVIFIRSVTELLICQNLG